MKKIKKIIWFYSGVFLFESIVFNLALAFAVVTIIKNTESISKWSIIAIIFSCLWIFQIFIKHFLWLKMKKSERALFLAIRKHGRKIVKISENELKSSGQSDIREFLTDEDSNLEVGMLINGTGTFINTFVGIKWFVHAIKWHKSPHVFVYEIKKQA